MQDRVTFFRLKPALENYRAVKALFILYLNETENKCSKLCLYKADQERNYSIGENHPIIIENRNKITNTKQRILEELTRIENVNQGAPEAAHRDLIQYGQRLAGEDVLSLFLTIFIGKLKKHWLPAVAGSLLETVSYQDYSGSEPRASDY